MSLGLIPSSRKVFNRTERDKTDPLHQADQSQGIVVGKRGEDQDQEKGRGGEPDQYQEAKRKNVQGPDQHQTKESKIVALHQDLGQKIL